MKLFTNTSAEEWLPIPRKISFFLKSCLRPVALHRMAMPE